jgi:hypothetical protein
MDLLMTAKFESSAWGNRQLFRLPLSVALATAAMGFGGCGTNHDPGRAPYSSLTDLESTYGPLITTGNHPTPQQNGTGERMGLFKDPSGTVWGLPLTVASDGSILGCAPPALANAPVTDTFPARATIIGATNEPTGWREGTGHLELVIRDSHGAIRRQVVGGSQLTSGSVCWAPQSPRPPQRLDYYRLIPSPE